MFKIINNNSGLKNGFWSYSNSLEEISYDLVRTYVSPQINTDMFVVQNYGYGSLIEISHDTEFEGPFDWAIFDSDNSNFKYNLYGRSLVYLLDTDLSIAEKVGFRSADQDYFYYGFSDNPSIKVVAVTKMNEDDGYIELYDGQSNKSQNEFGVIYTFSAHQYYRFARNSKYLICFGLGEPFK